MYIICTPRNAPERCLCECFFSYWALKIASVFDRGPEIGRGYHLYKKDCDSEKLGRVAEDRYVSRAVFDFHFACFCVTWSRMMV